MSYIVNGVKAKKVGVLLEPSTYDADITPENMQNGMTAYARGEKVIGTGKCFEFAHYGRLAVSKVTDENGNEKYGGKIFAGNGANLLFISPYSGDNLTLKTIFISPEENVAVKIGDNKTTGGSLYAYRKGDKVCVYSTETNDKKSQFYYFVGKDNEI